MTNYLYRKAMQAVTLATAIGALSFSLQAQFRVPQPERKTPRAIGVLETFKNGSRRLIPITFFYEKRYYDATFYHATPVPFTLYSETVYEVQQFGKPLGTYTLQSATQQASVWFGNGKFRAVPDAATLAKKAAAQAPVEVEDPSRPTLHRREGSDGDNPAPHPVAATGRPEVEDDPDRPKLHRREGSDAPSASTQAPAQGSDATSATPSQGSSSQASGGQTEESSGQDPDRPKLHRKDGASDGKSADGKPAGTGTSSGGSTSAKSTPETPSTGAGSAGAGSSTSAGSAATVVVASKTELTPSDDPDHPVLRRGKPVQEQSGRDLPDFKKEEPISRQVAVSDAGPSEVQPLIYVCPEDERQRIEASARELAQAELRRLGAQRGLVLSAAEKAPVAKTPAASAKRRVAPVPTELPLKEEQFVPYDLDYNNYATVVFSARYAPEGDLVASGKGKGWVVTLVARESDDGKLVKLYSAVSDPRELDLYPEVRLVDAVDPDGYGRMALMFREQKREGVSWLIGRPTGYELQTVFETPSR